MRTIPSYVFAGIGVALIALGVVGMIYSDTSENITFSAVIAALGLIQVIYGGLSRSREDDAPRADLG